MDMGHLSVDLVNSALESYKKVHMLRSQFLKVRETSILQIEVNDFATE